MNKCLNCGEPCDEDFCCDSCQEEFENDEYGELE